MNVLVINCGSSSLKFRLIDTDSETVLSRGLFERIGEEKGLKAIYAHFKELMETCPNWSFFLITADKNLEKEIGRKADRRRKLYNGQIETQFYQFHGNRPKSRKNEG